MAFSVSSPTCVESPQTIVSSYQARGSKVTQGANGYVVTPYIKEYVFETQKVVPKTGVMLVGLGGNNGSSFAGMIVANQIGLKWHNRKGEVAANFYGSLTQATSIRLGKCGEEEAYIPFKNVLPMVEPTNLVFGGWDINSMNLGDALVRASVFDYDLVQKLYPHLKGIVPLPSIYEEDFVASDQFERANHTLKGTKEENVNKIRKDIQNFKAANKLEKVIILWTANTERMSEEEVGVHDTAANILKAIHNGNKEIAPSVCFAMAAILEGCPFINGSPQNTLLPGVVELALQKGVFISGSDFKTGQTKIKSVLTDFLVSSGIKAKSIVSYNHLGNNDGRNLANPRCFKSKETSKTHVVDDIFLGNPALYGKDEHCDHCVVIKYVPYVGDSKRAMDEYSSEICMGGINTIALHNTCEDSLLAVPVMLDLVVLTELLTRIHIGERHPGKTSASTEGLGAPLAGGALKDVSFFPFHPLLGSILGFLLKAPQFPSEIPVVNSLFKQRNCLENLFRAARGLNIRTYIGVNKMFKAVQVSQKEKK